MARKLAGPNHSAWAQDTRQRLQRLGLWGVVSEEEEEEEASTVLEASSLRASTAPRRQAERAGRVIVDALEPHVLRDLLLTAQPSNLWSVLETKYRDQGFGCVLEKLFEYFDARISDLETSVEDHIAMMQARVDTLAAMGFKVSEDMQVVVLLRSLRGSRFAGFLQYARHLPHAPTLVDIIEMLTHFDAASPPPMNPKRTNTDEPSSALDADAPWGSMSTVSTASFASHAVSEEVIYAFARAVHSPSLDSSGSQSSTSSASAASIPSVSTTPCWCTHKHHTVN